MKKLKAAMIGGGGDGSFFGNMHLRATLLDGTREVVAGALRSTPDAAMEAAEKWGIQGFPTVEALVDAYKAGDLDIDYAIIVTPNFAHYGPAKLCLEAGLPLLCEKPMTMTVEESAELHELASTNDVPFVLAHTYTGHPMMMLAREMVKRGDIGDIRKIESWYKQGWLATKLEDDGQQQAAWRTDPARAGISNCGGDIGTHAFVAATWVSGLSIKRLSSRLTSYLPGRELDDDFNVFAEMENGATAVIVTSQISIGHKNDHGFSIYGTKATLEWHQERAEKLIVKYPDHDEVFWIGGNFEFFPENVASYLRAPSGHNEDFFPALANLHCSLERMIRAKRGEDVPAAYDHPGTAEGLAGMKFVKAAVESSKAGGVWLDV